MSQVISKKSISQEFYNMMKYPDIVKTQEYKIEVPNLHNMAQYQDLCHQVKSHVP